jgi:YcxB-like protein
MDTITINQTFSFPELFGGTLYVMFSKKVLRTIIIILLFVLFIQVSLAFLAGGKDSLSLFSVLPTLGAFVILSGLAFVFLLLVMLFIYTARKKYYTNAVYSFSEWGVNINSSGDDFSKNWKKFRNIKENKNHFYLYLTKLDVYIVQKSRLIESNELEKFRKLVYSKIN